MKRTRFKTVTTFPEGTMADVPMNDSVRSVVSPQHFTFINGSMGLTADGTRELCNAVISGRIPGNAEKSRQLLSDINQAFPQS